VLAECFVRLGDREAARTELATAIGIFEILGAEEQRIEAVEWASIIWGSGSEPNGSERRP